MLIRSNNMELFWNTNISKPLSNRISTNCLKRTCVGWNDSYIIKPRANLVKTLIILRQPGKTYKHGYQFNFISILLFPRPLYQHQIPSNALKRSSMD